MTALIIICAVFLACFIAMLIATHNAMPYDPSWDEEDGLRKAVAVWVEKNIGAGYVNEALDKYDKMNSGVPIGGFQETAIFLDMIERIKEERKQN